MPASSPIERIQSRRTSDDARARVIDIEDDDADEVLESLSSDTARRAFRTLHESPRTPSELADVVDTSVQNVHYHLSNLEDAGVVEPIDTVYSAQGTEMSVYAPASDPLVFVGDEQRADAARSALGDVVGGLALLGVASLLVQWGADRIAVEGGRVVDGVGSASTSQTGDTTGTLAHLVFDVLEPGLVFFVGCLVVAAVFVLAERR